MPAELRALFDPKSTRVSNWFAWRRPSSEKSVKSCQQLSFSYPIRHESATTVALLRNRDAKPPTKWRSSLNWHWRSPHASSKLVLTVEHLSILCSPCSSYRHGTLPIAPCDLSRHSQSAPTTNWHFVGEQLNSKPVQRAALANLGERVGNNPQQLGHIGGIVGAPNSDNVFDARVKSGKQANNVVHNHTRLVLSYCLHCIDDKHALLMDERQSVGLRHQVCGAPNMLHNWIDLMNILNLKRSCSCA